MGSTRYQYLQKDTHILHGECNTRDSSLSYNIKEKCLAALARPLSAPYLTIFALFSTVLRGETILEYIGPRFAPPMAYLILSLATHCDYNHFVC